MGSAHRGEGGRSVGLKGRRVGWAPRGRRAAASGVQSAGHFWAHAAASSRPLRPCSIFQCRFARACCTVKSRNPKPFSVASLPGGRVRPRVRGARPPLPPPAATRPRTCGAREQACAPCGRANVRIVGEHHTDAALCVGQGVHHHVHVLPREAQHDLVAPAKRIATHHVQRHLELERTHTQELSVVGLYASLHLDCLARIHHLLVELFVQDQCLGGRVVHLVECWLAADGAARPHRGARVAEVPPQHLVNAEAAVGVVAVAGSLSRPLHWLAQQVHAHSAVELLRRRLLRHRGRGSVLWPAVHHAPFVSARVLSTALSHE